MFERGIRHAERNGVEWSRARSGEVELAIVASSRFRALATHHFIKLFPFSSVAEVFFPRLWREADRPVSPLERMLDDIAMHQLLSGQLARRPTPMVSCLYDCGDRGFRPI